MHRSAGIHDAMTKLTGNSYQTSEQHKDLESSRMRRDKTDFLKLKACFSNNKPFIQDQPHLKSPSTGLHTTESDGVNWDRVEEVGQKIQEKSDSKSFTDASIRQSNKVKTLDALYVQELHWRDSVNQSIQWFFICVSSLLCNVKTISEGFLTMS